MITKETLAAMTAAQVAQLVTELRDQRNAAAANANTAINGYQSAVKDRDSKIQEMKDDLNRQLADIAGKTEALKPAMLKATIAGDSAGLNKVKRTLSGLEAQRSELAAQLELLNGKPPRCDEAYEAMEAAVAKSAEADEQFKSDAQVIGEFCDEAMRPWEEISSLLSVGGEMVSRFYLDRARSQYSSEQ